MTDTDRLAVIEARLIYGTYTRADVKWLIEQYVDALPAKEFVEALVERGYASYLEGDTFCSRCQFDANCDDDELCVEVSEAWQAWQDHGGIHPLMLGNADQGESDA